MKASPPVLGGGLSLHPRMLSCPRYFPFLDHGCRKLRCCIAPLDQNWYKNSGFRLFCVGRSLYSEVPGIWYIL